MHGLLPEGFAGGGEFIVVSSAPAYRVEVEGAGRDDVAVGHAGGRVQVHPEQPTADVGDAGGVDLTERRGWLVRRQGGMREEWEE